MKTMIALAVVVALGGCATTNSYHPIIDTKGVNLTQYEEDLNDCKHYAKRVDPARSAVAGGIIVGLFGAALGAAMGDQELMRYGAKVGIVDGVAAGTIGGVQVQRQVVLNCIAGRGYIVLGG